MWPELIMVALFAFALWVVAMVIDLMLWTFRRACWLHRWDVTSACRWHHVLTCRRCEKREEHGHG